QAGVRDVLAHALQRVMAEDVLARGSGHPAELRPILEGCPGHPAQIPGRDLVVERVLGGPKRRVALDRWLVHEPHAPAERRLVVAEAIPSVARRRPDDPGAGAAPVEFR